MPIDIRLNYEDYCLLPNNGKRYEIIDGELFVTPSPLRRHQLVLANLLYYLTDFVKKHGLGRQYTRLPSMWSSRQYDVVEPDILYVSKARASVVTEKNIQGAPDLVVEDSFRKHSANRSHDEVEALCPLWRWGILGD